MLELIHVSKSFDSKKLFCDLTFTASEGEFIIFTGESGCGKTTLLNMIGSIEKPDSGQIIYNNYDIFFKSNQLKYLREEVGFLFQNYALLDDRTVRQNLNLIKSHSRTDISFEDAMNFVNLPPEVLERRVYTLSGGEQQRVSVARLLVKKCSIILADEPTGSLDRGNAEQVFSLLEKLNGQGKTIIMVTHDPYFLSRGKTCIEL